MDKPQAIAAMSGGVDSTVAAKIAQQDYDIIPLIIDHGFMRKGEVEWVRKTLVEAGFDQPWVFDSEDYFRDEIGMQMDAEKKRLLFKKAYFGVLSEAARMMNIQTIIQGTIAPDWIESQGGIKTHHNVIQDYNLSIVEPIRELYKDQVREQAKKFELPDSILTRQPFPGPGLLLRCVGYPATYSRMEQLRECTAIVDKFLDEYKFGQSFCAFVHQDASVTGVKGDNRAYGRPYRLAYPESWETAKHYTDDPETTRVFNLVRYGTSGTPVVIRAVKTRDFMTAEAGELTTGILDDLSKALQGVGNVGDVYYDITPKPPGTVEFE